jgi:2,3-bisphosphoglycerate-dependent phosphoglycerate mutase
MSASVRLILVRHCLSTGQAPDAPLAPAGHKAAMALAETLLALGVGALFSSPYRRARETLEPLAEKLGLSITMDPRLRERTLSDQDLPDWRDHVAKSFQDRDHRAPGGETFNEVAHRALAALSDIAAAGHALPAAATHGNLLSALMHSLHPNFGYEDWQNLRNPDIFDLRLHDGKLVSAQRFRA